MRQQLRGGQSLAGVGLEQLSDERSRCSHRTPEHGAKGAETREHSKPRWANPHVFAWPGTLASQQQRPSLARTTACHSMHRVHRTPQHASDALTCMRMPCEPATRTSPRDAGPLRGIEAVVGRQDIRHDHRRAIAAALRGGWHLLRRGRPLERMPTREHDVQQHAERPHVDLRHARERGARTVRVWACGGRCMRSACGRGTSGRGTSTAWARATGAHGLGWASGGFASTPDRLLS